MSTNANVPTEQERARLSGGTIAVLVGVALLVLFMIQNTREVAVEFLFWDLNWPVWLMVLGAALLGAVVLYGLGVVRRHRKPKDA